MFTKNGTLYASHNNNLFQLEKHQYHIFNLANTIQTLTVTDKNEGQNECVEKGRNLNIVDVAKWVNFKNCYYSGMRRLAVSNGDVICVQLNTRVNSYGQSQYSEALHYQDTEHVRYQYTSEDMKEINQMGAYWTIQENGLRINSIDGTWNSNMRQSIRYESGASNMESLEHENQFEMYENVSKVMLEMIVTRRVSIEHMGRNILTTGTEYEINTKKFNESLLEQRNEKLLPMTSHEIGTTSHLSVTNCKTDKQACVKNEGRPMMADSQSIVRKTPTFNENKLGGKKGHINDKGKTSTKNGSKNGSSKNEIDPEKKVVHKKTRKLKTPKVIRHKTQKQQNKPVSVKETKSRAKKILRGGRKIKSISFPSDKADKWSADVYINVIHPRQQERFNPEITKTDQKVSSFKGSRQIRREEKHAPNRMRFTPHSKKQEGNITTTGGPPSEVLQRTRAKPLADLFLLNMVLLTWLCASGQTVESVNSYCPLNATKGHMDVNLQVSKLVK